MTVLLGITSLHAYMVEFSMVQVTVHHDSDNGVHIPQSFDKFPLWVNERDALQADADSFDLTTFSIFSDTET